MYGVPSDLNLDGIVGLRLSRICAGAFSIDFDFESGHEIMAQGLVEVIRNGEPVAIWNECGGWSTIAYQELLRLKIESYDPSNRSFLDIHFEGGLVLRFHDSSDALESFSVQPGNVFV